VKPGQLPAVKVARTVYKWSAGSLPYRLGWFVKWIRANGHGQAENLWEVYSGRSSVRLIPQAGGTGPASAAPDHASVHHPISRAASGLGCVKQADFGSVENTRQGSMRLDSAEPE
jgi:hypothetical protein